LDFKYLAGLTLPAAQNLQIKSTGTGLGLHVDGHGDSSQLFRAIVESSASSGTTPGAVKVYVNPFGLPSGNYTATTLLVAPKANTPLVSYTVTLEVGDAAPLLSVGTPDPGGTIAFAFVTDGAAPAHRAMTLMSVGGTLSATICVIGRSLAESSADGEHRAGGTAEFGGRVGGPDGTCAGVGGQAGGEQRVARRRAW